MPWNGSICLPEDLAPIPPATLRAEPCTRAEDFNSVLWALGLALKAKLEAHIEPTTHSAISASSETWAALAVAQGWPVFPALKVDFQWS